VDAYLQTEYVKIVPPPGDMGLNPFEIQRTFE
jgi:hypothetical protein